MRPFRIPIPFNKEIMTSLKMRKVKTVEVLDPGNGLRKIYLNDNGLVKNEFQYLYKKDILYSIPNYYLIKPLKNYIYPGVLLKILNTKYGTG